MFLTQWLLFERPLKQDQNRASEGEREREALAAASRAPHCSVLPFVYLVDHTIRLVL